MNVLGLRRLQVTDPFALIHLKSPAKIAECLMLNVKFAKDDWGNIYYYDKGVYKMDSSLWVIGHLYQMILQQYNHTERWYARGTFDIAKYIVTKVPLILDRPLSDRINLLNGIFYFGTEETGTYFRSHEEEDHSDYITTVQIPINYNQGAICPSWDIFLHELFPEQPDLLLSVIALCLVPFTEWQRCIVLLGSGSNGKSTFLDALQRVIGRDNCSNLNLEQLNGRFDKTALVGKLANVFGDLPHTVIQNTSMFKALVGGDAITIEYKGKDIRSYLPFARLLYSCNKALTSTDESVGYLRRFFCIPLDTEFEPNATKKKELEDTLFMPIELSGLLNKMILVLPELMEKGPYLNQAARMKLSNYETVPNWFKEWFGTLIVREASAPTTVAISCTGLYNAYFAVPKIMVNPSPYNQETLLKYLKALMPWLQVMKGLTPDGVEVSCYVGVTLTTVDNRYRIVKLLKPHEWHGEPDICH